MTTERLLEFVKNINILKAEPTRGQNIKFCSCMKCSPFGGAKLARWKHIGNCHRLSSFVEEEIKSLFPWSVQYSSHFTQFRFPIRLRFSLFQKQFTIVFWKLTLKLAVFSSQLTNKKRVIFNMIKQSHCIHRVKKQYGNHFHCGLIHPKLH